MSGRSSGLFSKRAALNRNWIRSLSSSNIQVRLSPSAVSVNREVSNRVWSSFQGAPAANSESKSIRRREKRECAEGFLLLPMIQSFIPQVMTMSGLPSSIRRKIVLFPKKVKDTAFALNSLLSRINFLPEMEADKGDRLLNTGGF